MFSARQDSLLFLLEVREGNLISQGLQLNRSITFHTNGRMVIVMLGFSMMGTICTFASLIKGPRLLRGALTKDGVYFFLTH